MTTTMVVVVKIRSEFVLFEVWSEFVDPAETARLAAALQEAFGLNGAPVSGAVFLDMVEENFVFFRFPRAFLHLCQLAIAIADIVMVMIVNMTVGI